MTSHEGAVGTLQAIATRWNHHGIAWVVVGRYSEDHRFESDIDVVVRPSQLKAAIKIMEDLCQERDWSIVQVFRHERRAFAAVVAQRGEKGWRFVSIDISSEFRYSGRLIQTGDALVDQRIQRQNGWLYTPCAQEAFTFYLIKSVAKRRYDAVVRSYLNSLPTETTALTTRLLGPTTAEHISAWLDHDEPIDADAVHAAFTTRYPLGLRGRLYETSRAWLRLRYPCGLHLALTGPDGVGKSTVTQNVCQTLLACFRNIETTHLDVRTTQMTTAPQAVVPYRDKPRGLIGSLAKTLLLVLRFQRLYWGLSFLHRRQHGLLWSDRHFSDFVADQERFRVKLPRWLRHLSWALVPQPDLTFVLLSSPQIIQQRSREVDFEQTAEQIKHYELLLDGRKRLRRIDATPAPDAVALTILDAVIELLAQRQKVRGWMIR